MEIRVHVFVYLYIEKITIDKAITDVISDNMCVTGTRYM